MGNTLAPSRRERDAAAAHLAELVARKPVVVLGVSGCMTSTVSNTVAQQLFRRLKIDFAYVDAAYAGDGDAMFDEIARQNGLREVTYPAVFIGGKYVGGNREIKILHDEGKLLEMVARASAS